MQLHQPHAHGRSRPLVSIVLAFVALFIPGCDALEPFLRARTLGRMVTPSIECAAGVTETDQRTDRAELQTFDVDPEIRPGANDVVNNECSRASATPPD